MQETGELAKAVLVFGQMSDPPGCRFRVVLMALTIAEYFRDVRKCDLMFLVDNILCYVQAGSEASGLLGRLPSEVGYQPTLADDLRSLEERIASVAVAAITSFQAVYVPADVLADPAVAQTLVHLDASIVLSRALAAPDSIRRSIPWGRPRACSTRAASGIGTNRSLSTSRRPSSGIARWRT